MNKNNSIHNKINGNKGICHLNGINDYLSTIESQIDEKNENKTPFITMMINSKDAEFYFKHYGMKKIYNDGERAIIQSKIQSEHLNDLSFCKFEGIVDYGDDKMKKKIEKEKDNIGKDYNLFLNHCSSKISEDITNLENIIKTKKELIKKLNNEKNSLMKKK